MHSRQTHVWATRRVRARVVRPAHNSRWPAEPNMLGSEVERSPHLQVAAREALGRGCRGRTGGAGPLQHAAELLAWRLHGPQRLLRVHVRPRVVRAWHQRETNRRCHHVLTICRITYCSCHARLNCVPQLCSITHASSRNILVWCAVWRQAGCV